MNTKLIGAYGEQLAARYLRGEKYKILAANYRAGTGEIDIIAEKRKVICFVEVKTRKEGALVSGIDAVDSNKQQRLNLAALDYITRTRCEKQPRFDVAEVYLQESGKLRIDYLENAFT